jgi:teichuronic acid biosynthesis protein TuaE
MVLIVLIPAVDKFTIKKALVGLSVLMFLVGVWALPHLIQIENWHGLNRMYSAFDEISRGAELMAENRSTERDSTGLRAALYMFGIHEFIETYGLGLGVGGIEARLMQENYPVAALHFFFLQMLVDFGVVLFAFFILCYAALVLKLIRIARNSNTQRLYYYAKCSAVSLLVAIPASMAPSVVHYILPFYILIGFALGILKLTSIRGES